MKKALYMYVREIVGLRSSAYAHQRTISCISYIIRKYLYLVCSYIEQTNTYIAGAESVDKASVALLTLQNLLGSLNRIKNPDKVTPPPAKMIFLGKILNSKDLTTTITEENLQEIGHILNQWLLFTHC